MTVTAPVLELERLTKRYGALTATDDVSLSLEPGTRHALIGPNGAGKTTLFNLVAGLIAPSSGRIRFRGKDITGRSEAARCRLGIGRTFQHSSLFSSATCAENVMLALRRRYGKGSSWWLSPSLRAQVSEEANELVQRVGLVDRAHDPVDALSHGERRQLEVAMALSVEPALILFDEPTAGMSQAESDRFTRLVAGLSRDITVLFIEHDLDVVFSLADRVTVLATGGVLMTGNPDEVRRSPRVEEIYLGSGLDEVFIV